MLILLISTVRKLVNGTPALLDSLTITNESDRETMRIAYQIGYSDNFVTLQSTPIVGGSKDDPVLWHEVSLFHPNPKL